MKGFQFVDALVTEFRKRGTAGKELMLRTESGDYVPFDIKTEDDKTIVFLLEAGK